MNLKSKFIKRSPWIFHVNSGACNGCDIEVVAALTPKFDVERFGILLKGSPRHADILIVTGPLTAQTYERVLRVYEQVPKPKIVVAIGSCCLTKGIFDGSYALKGPVDQYIPISVYVPGCPPRPEAIIRGIYRALEIMSEKYVMV